MLEHSQVEGVVRVTSGDACYTSYKVYFVCKGGHKLALLLTWVAFSLAVSLIIVQCLCDDCAIRLFKKSSS